MKALYLLRHAQAGSVKTVRGDRDRPLNAQGLTNASAIGAHMQASGLLPDRVLCSDSRRTRETLEIILDHIANECDARIDPDLYLANPDETVSRIRKLGGDAERLLVIGHNPGLAMLAHQISMSHDLSSVRMRGGNFPPAGLAVFETDTPHWREFEPAQARLHDFVTPADIANRAD